MAKVFQKCLLISSVLLGATNAMAEEAVGQISSLAVGHPYAPMSVMVVIDDLDGGNTYPGDCDNGGVIFSDMSGDNAVDREDSQAYYSFLQTAKTTAQDVIVYYHVDGTSGTYTETHCVIDAVSYAP